MTGKEDEDGPARWNQMGKKPNPAVLEAEDSIMWLGCKRGEGKVTQLMRQEQGKDGVGHGEPASERGKRGWPDGILGPLLWRCQEWIRDGKIGDVETSKELYWERDGKAWIPALVMDRKEMTDSRESIEVWGVREDEEYEMTGEEEDGWEKEFALSS